MKILKNKWKRINIERFVPLGRNKVIMKNEQTLGILDKEQSLAIRAVCCIIVVLVHVPQQHGNFIQDAIGSFGYIAVTLFFMLSAYGLKYSVENKKDYLKNFWRNRVLILLIPFWLVNIIAVLLNPQEGIVNNLLAIIGLKNISFITVYFGQFIKL